MGLDLKNPVCVESVKLLGDYWMLRIINALEQGGMRFGDIAKHAQGISTATLTDRLKKLEAAGLVERKEKSRADVTYELTELGKSAIPFLVALNEFAQKVEASKANI